MIEKLRTLPPIASCHLPPTKKKAQNVANKKKSRNLIKIEQKSNPEYGQNINPISRLIQIQQAKKEKEPVYTLIAERGMPRRREFVMQVGLHYCFFLSNSTSNHPFNHTRTSWIRLIICLCLITTASIITLLTVVARDVPTQFI